jgi:hypothetical protein
MRRIRKGDAMSAKLKEAAKTINALARQEEDARLQFCIAIAGAMDLVKKESNLTWAEWANQNLRKPDGTKWALQTLYKCAMYGRNPKKLSRARETISDLGRRARRSLNPALPASPISRQNDARPIAATSHPTRAEQQVDIDKEVNWLLSAWKNAGPAARKRFLELIAEKESAA